LWDGGRAGLSSVATPREAIPGVTLIDVKNGGIALGAGVTLNGGSLLALRDLGVHEEEAPLGIADNRHRLYDALGRVR
jgi:hypothetical protein